MEKKEKKRKERGAREKRREEGLNRRGGQASSWQPTVMILMRYSRFIVSKCQHR